MYATLHEFLRMTPEQQACVTELDLAIADDEDLYRARSREPDTRETEEVGR